MQHSYLNKEVLLIIGETGTETEIVAALIF